jgi:hypothetical protein
VSPYLTLRRRVALTLVVAVTTLVSACGNGALNVFGLDGYVWEQRGTWSGHGSLRTESFPGKTGGLRLTWNTRQTPLSPPGTFTVGLYNAETGRKINDAIDVRWAAHGTAFLMPEPHPFYLVVDAKDVDWTVTVEETVPSS